MSTNEVADRPGKNGPAPAERDRAYWEETNAVFKEKLLPAAAAVVATATITTAVVAAA
jgi:hypothetical protein